MATCRDTRTFILKIDCLDKIIWVNDHWLDFARENGAPKLAESSLIGQSLWKHISDISTTHLYQTLVTKSRQELLFFTIPYRCDAPDLRRFMEMDIVPDVDGNISFESVVLKLEPRAPVRLLDPTIERSESFLYMCSYCKKLQVDKAHWSDVEEAIVKLNIFSDPRPPQISHTICPVCYDVQIQAFRNGRKERCTRSSCG